MESQRFVRARQFIGAQRPTQTAAGMIAASICAIALLGATGCAQTPTGETSSSLIDSGDNPIFSIEGENATDAISTDSDIEELSEEDVRLITTAREALDVPTDRAIICSLGKEYYWEEGQQYLQSVSFLEDGELCAGADCAQDGTPVRNIVPY